MTPLTPAAAAVRRDVITPRTWDSAGPAARAAAGCPACAGGPTQTGRPPARTESVDGDAITAFSRSAGTARAACAAPVGTATVPTPAAGQLTRGRCQACITGTLTLCDGTACTG